MHFPIGRGRLTITKNLAALALLVSLAAVHPIAAWAANGAISAGAAQAAAIAAAAASNSLGANPRGLDSQLPHQPFDIAGQQMMDLSTSGLGINVKPATEALDVGGYLRIRAVNTYGGVIYLDGAPVSGYPAGQRVWLLNNQGAFSIMGEGGTIAGGAGAGLPVWGSVLMSVTQTGNVTTTGNIFSNGEIQATGKLRIMPATSGAAAAGLYSAIWNNDGTTSSLVFTNPGDLSGSPSGATPALSVDDTSGAVTFNSGATIGAGGLSFADNTVQTTASSYGGEYSMKQPAGGGTALCQTTNYKTGGCSCPSGAPNSHKFVDAPDSTGANNLQVFVCTSD